MSPKPGSVTSLHLSFLISEVAGVGVKNKCLWKFLWGYVSSCTSNPGVSCLPFKGHLPPGDWGESSTCLWGGPLLPHRPLQKGAGVPVCPYPSWHTVPHLPEGLTEGVVKGSKWEVLHDCSHHALMKKHKSWNFPRDRLGGPPLVTSFTPLPQISQLWEECLSSDLPRWIFTPVS